MDSRDLREKFLERKPALEVFGSWVIDKIVDQVKELEGASYSEYFFKVQPKCRVKDVDGFLEKANRKGKNYSDPLVDITDQVGCRFVVLLHFQCSIVNNAICAIPNWDCTSAKDVEEIRINNPHHFDYESYHWTVRLKTAQEINGHTIPADYVCEVQVRTLLQHAYAELAHSTVYKPKTVARPEVKRILARGAALIETTDGVFVDVARKIQEATGMLDELLRNLAAWYSANVISGTYPASPIALRIADSYIEELSKINWSKILEYLQKKPWLAECIKEKIDLPLFNDPIILLVFWLVSELQTDMTDHWPLDLTLLVPVFTRLGLSSGDSLH